MYLQIFVSNFDSIFFIIFVFLTLCLGAVLKFRKGNFDDFLSIPPPV